MRRRKQILSILLGLSLTVLIGGIFFHYGYVPSFSSPSSGGYTVRSPLLPTDWQTYRTDAWSIGYPDDWNVTVGTDRVTLASTTELMNTVVVTNQGVPYEDVVTLYDRRATLSADEVLFAGYTSIKYTFANGSAEYVVDYPSQAVVLVATRPLDSAVGIILATFNFLK